jgi:beta-lactam-binding protein with PASTA domain
VAIVKAPARACRVPKLLGKTLPPARRLLRAAHCRLGQVAYTLTTARKRGRIVAQRPRAGARRNAGARVNVVVGRGPRR